MLVLAACATAGASALSFAIASVHGLGPTLGTGAAATAILLATLLAGTAVGTRLDARFARMRARSFSPWLGAHCLIALWAFSLPIVLGIQQALVRVGHGFGLPASLTGAVSLLVFLPPAVAAGMTWPAHVRLLERCVPGVSAGRLAARVTVALLGGALVGGALTVLQLLPAAGIGAASTGAGVAGVLAVALLAWVGRPPEGEAVAVTESETTEASSGASGVVLFISGLAGFGALTLLSRALGMLVGEAPRVRDTALLAACTGLLLGAIVIRVLASRVKTKGRALHRALSAFGLAGAGALLYAPMLGRLVGATGEGATIVALALVGAPAVLLGTLLPLALLDAGTSHEVGRRLGWWSVGAATGAAMWPLILVPLLGWNGSWILVAVLPLIGSLGLARSRRERLATGAIAGGIVVGLGLSAFPDRAGGPLLLHGPLFEGRAGQERRLLEWEVGRSTTLAVTEETTFGSRALHVDGIADGSQGRIQAHHRLLGHLPALLAADPAQASVFAFRTGATAGAIAMHPGVEHLRVVASDASFFHLAPRFRHENHDVLEMPYEGDASTTVGPSVAQVVRPGRLELLMRDEPAGLITLEATRPGVVARSHLHTVEFYEQVRGRLAPGGVFAQAVPVDGLAARDHRAIVRTFLEVFPQGELWFTGQASLLVARDAGKGPALAEVRDRAAVAVVEADLRRASFLDLEDLLAARVASGDRLASTLGGARVLRDDHPVIGARAPGNVADIRRERLATLSWLCEAAEAPGEDAAVLSGIDEAARDRIGRLRSVRRALLVARRGQAKARLEAGARGWAVEPLIVAFEQAAAAVPGHLEARRLANRLRYEVATGRAGQMLAEGEPEQALALLAPFDGFPEERASSIETRTLAWLALGAPEPVRRALRTRRLERMRGRAILAASLERLGHPRAAAAIRTALRERDAEAAERAFTDVSAVLAAARERGFGSSRWDELTRELLGKAEARDLLGDAGAALELRATLGLAADDMRWPLLGEQWLEVDGNTRSNAAGQRSGFRFAEIRPPFLLDAEHPPAGIDRAVWRDLGQPRRLEASLQVQSGLLAVLGPRAAFEQWVSRTDGSRSDRSVEEVRAARRLVATIAVRDPANVTALLPSLAGDAVARELLCTWAPHRGGRQAVPWLLDLLADPVSDVRLGADLALRAITGLDADFDFSASPEERQTALARWRALVGR